jgi:hypothetical protein
LATNEIHTPLNQRAGALAFAAAGTPLNSAGTEKAALPPKGTLQLAVGNAKATASQVSQAPAANTCQQCLTVSFFFDGTGNNFDADVGTMQHSNVARLFDSHLLDSVAVGRYSFYIPGLGTYFKEINDAGHNKLGLGMGYMGQDRLDWAFKKFDEALKEVEARATNPTNKVQGIKVSVFGFSRGATAARAFVRDLAARCVKAGNGHQLKQQGYPIEVIFLGIFDTVASVGLPMSANNTPGATSAGWYSTQTTLNVRAESTSSGILAMAFGDPGADPAPGDHDGHGSWADGLQVPDLVKRCVHMVAGHEVRNSFPVDSALFGTRYPAGVSEMVYPGAHSDVGGGYQPGEGARSAHYGEVLSLVPLRTMHSMALEAGVPLRSAAALATAGERISKAFALDPEGAAKYAEMSLLMQKYMGAAGSGGRDIGKELLAHGAWYLRWRFFNIRRKQRAGGKGPDEQSIAQREPGFAAERRRLSAEVAKLQAKSEQADANLSRAEARLFDAQYETARIGLAVNPQLQADVAQARSTAQVAKDAYLRRKAELDTYADDSALAANLAAYDKRLVQDAEAIIKHHSTHPELKLRPHYSNLVEAYNAQYKRGDPLDVNVVAFFDRYVHDSLSGFATDATLPSDPRVIYVGGDNKLRFANAESQGAGDQTLAA